MGHLHRQALVQRAKARDALIAAGFEPVAAKANVAACQLASLSDSLRPLESKPTPASTKTVARKRGKKRGTKKKA